MMLGTAGTVAFLDYKVTRDEGSYGVARAMLRIAGAADPEKSGLRSDGQDDFDLILRANQGLGQDLLRTENQVIAPFMSHDREKTITALKSYLGKTSFGGIVTLVDEKGLVFYSSDTPGTSNYSIKSNPAFQPYFEGEEAWSGYDAGLVHQNPNLDFDRAGSHRDQQRLARNCSREHAGQR